MKALFFYVSSTGFYYKEPSFGVAFLFIKKEAIQMEKKEIKDKLAELVEDGAVTLREALDLEDNEVEFLSK